MRPEVTIIEPQHVAARQEEFYAAAERFGQEYARGQNMFSIGRDFVARITGRQTPFERLTETGRGLRETQLNLAETIARQTAQSAPDNTAYRQQLATAFASSYYATKQEILATAQAENTNLGPLDHLYRAYLVSGVVRLAGGAGFIYYPQQVVDFIQSRINIPQLDAVTTTEIGIFIAATGAVDLARQLFLTLSARNNNASPVDSTASLIKRKAAIDEGQITGDEIMGSQNINTELEQRLAGEILNQLEIDGIRMPTRRNPDWLAAVLTQRESLRYRLPRYDDLSEIVRSRDISKVSRLTRTLAASILALGLIMVHVARPEDCGVRTFPYPDYTMQRETGGATNISSWRGIAENEWYKRIYGRDFNSQDPQDHIRYLTAYNYDPEGNNRLIEQIVVLLKRKNPQIDSAGRDLLQHGVMREVCPNELDSIFNVPVPSRSN